MSDALVSAGVGGRKWFSGVWRGQCRAATEAGHTCTEAGLSACTVPDPGCAGPGWCKAVVAVDLHGWDSYCRATGDSKALLTDLSAHPPMLPRWPVRQ